MSHALLSPSASHRWIACPPSARLTEFLVDTGSSFAAEGTLAHSVAESKLNHRLGRAGPAPPCEDGEMDEYTTDYANFVLEQTEGLVDPVVYVEQRIDCSAYVPECYNQLMAGRKDVIDSCELMRSALVDFAALDAEIQRQTEEAEVVAELVRALVKENAATAQDQEVYRQKYESLTRRHEAAMAELDRLNAERAHRQQQDKEMARFIRTLKAQRLVLTEWDNTVWTVMVEKAIVHRDGSITFVFYNGTEIKVGE